MALSPFPFTPTWELGKNCRGRPARSLKLYLMFSNVHFPGTTQGIELYLNNKAIKLESKYPTLQQLQ